MAFDNYFTGPREDVLRENVLKANELLVDVTVPALAPNTKTAWFKLKDRQVYDFAVASVAAVVTSENGVWKDGRIVLGGVSPVPYRAKVVEDALVGKSIKDSIHDAAARLRTVARPMSLNAHKVNSAPPFPDCSSWPSVTRTSKPPRPSAICRRNSRARRIASPSSAAASTRRCRLTIRRSSVSRP